MKITIIQIGKDKDQFVQEGVEKFKKVLQSFVSDLEILTLKEVSPSKTFSEERCIEEESEEILKTLEKLEKKSSGNLVIFILDEKGREYTSREFAAKLGKTSDQGREIVFVIGGAFGLSPKIKGSEDFQESKFVSKFSKISFSKMTFTHQMIRIFLLEQIYRACCILKGKKYHHD